MRSPKVASTRLALPLGVSGLEPDDAEVGTLAFATDTEQVRVKKIAGWADVGGGGGGSITSVNAADTTITVVNPTGPSVTLAANVGTTAGTVAAGDDPRFGSGTITSVDAGDTTLLATNPTGPLVTLVANTGTTAGTVAAGDDPRFDQASGIRLYTDVPSSSYYPGFNDELSSGNPDLAARGFTVVQRTTGATLTRAGDVIWDQQWLGNAIANGTYRSTIIGGVMYIQVNDPFWAYKTWPGIGLYTVRAHPETLNANYSASGVNTAGLFASAGSPPATTSYIFAITEKSGGQQRWSLYMSDGVWGDSVVRTVQTQEADQIALNIDGSPNLFPRAKFLSAATGIIADGLQNNGSNTFAPAKYPTEIGIYLECQSFGGGGGVASGSSICSVSAFRCYTASSWFGKI